MNIEAPASAVVDAQLAGQAVLTGIVTDATTQEPVENAMVQVRDPHGGDLYPGEYVFTDSDGEYAVPNLAVGNHTMWVYASGYGVVDQNVVVNASGNADVTLSPAHESRTIIVTESTTSHPIGGAVGAIYWHGYPR